MYYKHFLLLLSIIPLLKTWIQRGWVNIVILSLILCNICLDLVNQVFITFNCPRKYQAVSLYMFTVQLQTIKLGTIHVEPENIRARQPMVMSLQEQRSGIMITSQAIVIQTPLSSQDFIERNQVTIYNYIYKQNNLI